MRCSWFTTLPALFVTFTLLTGCSISYSTGKSSDSISASFDSISGSSASGGETAAISAANLYVEDVVAATVHYASNRENSEQFLHAISNIARRHGIVDWEREDMTYGAMGRGLRRAGVTEQQIGELPYFHTLTGSTDFKLLLVGYHQS
jgi:hypothetical protein